MVYIVYSVLPDEGLQVTILNYPRVLALICTGSDLTCFWSDFPCTGVTSG